MNLHMYAIKGEHNQNPHIVKNESMLIWHMYTQLWIFKGKHHFSLARNFFLRQHTLLRATKYIKIYGEQNLISFWVKVSSVFYMCNIYNSYNCFVRIMSNLTH